MKTGHIFNIETLISIDQSCWIIDKRNPNIPIMKISQSDFNLIKSGIYKSHGNKIEYNGNDFWLPTEIFNKLKVKIKNSHSGLSDIGISMQEFLNKDIINNANYKLLIDNISHLYKKEDDVFILCSKQTRKNYNLVIEKLKEELSKSRIEIKKTYFISETFYNQNNDDIIFKKAKIILEHLIGYKTDNISFINEELDKYNIINFYDNQFNTLKMIDDINLIFKSLLNKSDDGLKSVIMEDIKDEVPSLVVNYVTDNTLNRKISKKIDIKYFNIIKTFESFKLRH